MIAKLTSKPYPMKHNQKGFSVAELLIALLVVGALGAAGWFVFNRSQDANNTSNTTDSQQVDENTATPATYVAWEWNGEAWMSRGSAPTCEDPYVIAAPMDADKATSLLYPGQVRGGDFKPHGGIGIENSATGNTVDVYAARDFYLYRGSRYIENGALQYMFDFVDACGFLHRYDHLAAVSEEMEQYVKELPEAKQDDSRTTNFGSNALIKQGAVIAVKVGYENNAFFDYGLFDLRKPNEASKMDIYKTDQGRISDKQLSFYSVCWFDYLNTDDKQTIKALPARGIEGKTSDYCR